MIKDSQGKEMIDFWDYMDKVGDFMFRQYEGYKAGVIDSRSILS